MRRAYDSVDPTAVPANGDVYMGYDDGAWPDAPELASRFPGKTIIRITTDPNDNEGDMLDVERGDANPGDAPGWTFRRRTAGHGGPLVYFPESSRDDVLGAFQSAGIAVPGLFVAAYPGVGASLQRPTDAGHQYEGYPGNSPGDFDVSVVIDYLPGIDPSPKPGPPPPPPITEEMMATDPTTKKPYCTDPAGDFFGNGAVPHVVTLGQIRAAAAAKGVTLLCGTAAEPCVGVTPEGDVSGPTAGQWGYTFITKPGTPTPGSPLGPYNRWHVNRDGSF